MNNQAHFNNPSEFTNGAILPVLCFCSVVALEVIFFNQVDISTLPKWLVAVALVAGFGFATWIIYHVHTLEQKYVLSRYVSRHAAKKVAEKDQATMVMYRILALEKGGIPIASIFKELGRKDLLTVYEHFLLSLHGKFRKLGTLESKQQVLQIEQLPTWKGMLARENAHLEQQIKDTANMGRIGDTAAMTVAPITRVVVYQDSKPRDGANVGSGLSRQARQVAFEG